MNILKVIILGQLLLEAMDDIRSTTLYKQNIKQQGNRFISMLESHVADKYDSVYDVDKESTTNVLNKISSLVDELSSLSVVELVMIEALINDYKSNKDEYNEKLKTYFDRVL